MWYLCQRCIAPEKQQRCGKKRVVINGICHLGQSQARGTVIMIKPKSQIEVTKYMCDHEGRNVICNIKKMDSEYTLCNVYGPNLDNPGYFKSVCKTLTKHSKENLIIGGDFNLTINNSIDRYCSTTNNHKSVAYLQSFMEENRLTDVWRDRNPDQRSYTWMRRNPGKHFSASRIDMLIINNGLACNVVETSIKSSCRTDHALIELVIENPEY